VFVRLLRGVKMGLFAVLLTSSAGRAVEPPSVPGLEGGEVEDLELELGEQRVISAEGVRSYSEATRGVVDVRLTRDAKQFVLVAASPGTTSLLFLMNNGRERHLRVKVADPSAKLLQPEGAVSVQRAENIRLDFYFVQLDKSYSHRIGPVYPTSIQGGTLSASYDFLTQSFTSATAVVEDQALLRLDVAEASGWVKVLRQAAVITANGQPAKFYGGGEVNVAVTGSLSTNIQSITFGSAIQVLPRFDRESGRIEIELEAEVSDLTDDRGTGVPGRSRSTLKTLVNLSLGQVIVLGGLSASSELEARGGLPFLSQIPILGALFRSQAAERSQTDNLVFIAPSVVDTPTALVRRQLDEAFAIYTRFRGQKAVQAQLRRRQQ
jgi:pilus assembly protein CpaC